MNEPLIYRAKTVVTMEGPPIENGAVAIAGDRIATVGRFKEVQKNGGEVIDLGEMVILPGLINAHCHLDFTSLRGLIAPQRSFADWIRQINGLRRELTDEDYLQSIARGFAEAKRWGTTTIANVESMPALLNQMAPPPIRTWWFAELIDVQPRVSAEEMIEQALAAFQNKEGWPGGFGLSPHAPYTASSKLSRLAVETARRRGLPLTAHVAESQEEMEMFRDRRGPLFDLLKTLGRPMEDCGGKTPLAAMLDRAQLDERWIVVHLNELEGEDFARLAQGPRFQIAHCPRSARYFKHRRNANSAGRQPLARPRTTLADGHAERHARSTPGTHARKNPRRLQGGFDRVANRKCLDRSLLQNSRLGRRSALDDVARRRVLEADSHICLSFSHS
jgi:cytosine/adenosine deaminase-related metal-dependent hydrolase